MARSLTIERGRLEELRSAGLIRRASEVRLAGEPSRTTVDSGGAGGPPGGRADPPDGAGPGAPGAGAVTGLERVLPVAAALRPLFPDGGLRRGGTVAVTSAVSRSRSLLFALLAESSTAGSWCAAVGLPDLGLVAAAEAGVAIPRFALVPHPGPDWVAVVAALLDGVDIVVTATPGPVPARMASRLAARARQRGSVLVAVGQWPSADITLEPVGAVWHGLGQGRGRLRRQEIEVRSYGRGAAARARRVHVALPVGLGSSSEASPREASPSEERRLRGAA